MYWLLQQINSFFPTRGSIGILIMDFEGIFDVIFFIVSFTPALCVKRKFQTAVYLVLTQNRPLKLRTCLKTEGADCDEAIKCANLKVRSVERRRIIRTWSHGGCQFGGQGQVIDDQEIYRDQERPRREKGELETQTVFKKL